MYHTINLCNGEMLCFLSDMSWTLNIIQTVLDLKEFNII
jgi:hypothetical protein